MAWARVENNAVQETTEQSRPFNGPDGVQYPANWLLSASEPERRAIGWYTIELVESSPGANEVFDKELTAYDSALDRVTRIRLWRARTAADDAADAERQRQNDINKIREKGASAVVLLIRLIDVLSAKGTIAPEDFSQAARQEYQELTPIADRLDPPP